MTKRMIVMACGTALLIVVAVVVAIRERQPALPMPEASVSQTPAEVHVKAVERNVETLDLSNAEAAKFSKKRPRRTSMEFGILLPETE